MPDTIRTKQELLDIFADADLHRITKQDIRDFIVSNHVAASQVENTPSQEMEALSDIFVAVPGATSMILPITTEYGDRIASVINISGGDLTINTQFSETIDGQSSTTLADAQFALFAGAEVEVGNWATLVNTTPISDPDEYALAVIAGSGATTNIIDNTYADINDVLVDVAESLNMVIGANEVTYVGIENKLFAIDASLFIAANGDQYTSAIVVNGSPVAEMQQDLSNAKSGSCSLFTIIQLVTNDTIKVQVRGDGTDNDVGIPDMHLRLTEIRT